MATALEDLEELYARHQAALIRHARSRLTDPSEAQDFVHESFVRVAERVDLALIENPRAYLMRAVDNAIFNGYRQHSRVSIREMDVDLPDPESDVAREHEREEARRMVGESLETLAPRHRRILKMFAGGVPLADIAAAESSTPHRISCIITRAKENLGRELVRRGFVPGVVPSTSFPRVRGFLFEVRTRLTGIMERMDRDAVVNAAMAATIVAAGAGGAVAPSAEASSTPAETRPIPAFTEKLPVDDLLNNVESTSSVTGLAQGVAAGAKKSARAIVGRGGDFGPPPEEQGPIPEPPVGPDPNEVVDEAVNIATHVAWEVVEVSGRCLSGELLCQAGE